MSDARGKAGRDLGVLLAGLLLLGTVRVSRAPDRGPIPVAVAAQPVVLEVAEPPELEPEPVPHVEVRVLRVELVRNLEDAVAGKLPRLSDVARCAS